MFLHYIKISFRNIEKHWVQSLIKILEISFAITCLILSLYWIQYETSYDGFYPKANHIYRVYTFEKQSGKIDKGSSKVIEKKLCEQYPGIEASTSLMRSQENCRTQKIPHIKMQFLCVDSSFFQVFPQKIISGDKIQPLQVLNNLVLTETMAIRLFGSVEKAIGQQVQTKMREGLPPYIVTAVVKEPPVNTNLAFDGLIYHNMLATISEMPDQIQWSFMEVYVKFNANTNIDNIIKKACNLPSQLKTNTNNNIEVRMVSLTNVRHDLEANSPFTLNFIHLFIISGILLLIAALFNFFNLHFDLLKQRTRELNLRSVNGASSKQLMSQLLFELMCPTILAIILSVCLLIYICPAFSNLLDLKINLSHLISLSFICYTFLVITILLIGYILFLKLIHNSILPQKKHRDTLPIYKRMTVSLQLFVSMIFIIITLIVMRQMNYINQKDLGFKSDGLIQLSGFVDYGGHIETKLINEIKTIPQVLCVSDANFEPKHEPDPTYMTNEVKWQGAPSEIPLFNVLLADSHFAESLHLRMLDGAWWNEGEITKAVLNEEAVRKMNITNPIGTVIKMPSQADKSVMANYEITGVVKDFHTLSFRNLIPPTIFISSTSYKFNILYIRTEKSQELEVIQRIRKMLPSIDASLTDVELAPVKELYNRLNSSEQIGLKMFSVLAVVCLLISLFGIYAIALSSTQRRRKEIAIRKVVGAETKDIVHIFLKEYISQVVWAAVFALPIAYLIMNNWLQDYAYRTNIPLWLFLSVVIGVIVLVVITILGQIVYAASRNPAEEIKRE